MLSSFLASPSPALPVNGKGVCPSPALPVNGKGVCPTPALPVNGKGVSPRFLGAAVSPRPNDGPAIMSWCGGIKGGTGVASVMLLGFGRAGVEMLRSAQHDSPLSFPRVRGNQKGASPACGGIRRGLPPRAGE